MMPEPVHSFQGQKFHKLRRACRHRGVLFKDPLFPPSAQSLFYKREPPPGLTWKRPRVRRNRVQRVQTRRGDFKGRSITRGQRRFRLRLYLCLGLNSLQLCTTASVHNVPKPVVLNRAQPKDGWVHSLLTLSSSKCAEAC